MCHLASETTIQAAALWQVDDGFVLRSRINSLLNCIVGRLLTFTIPNQNARVRQFAALGRFFFGHSPYKSITSRFS